MDDEGNLRSLLNNSTSEETYALVSEDLEQLVWQLALWPTSRQPQRHPPRVEQMGVIMEIMPNVYAQSLTIIENMVPYHSIQVWGVVKSSDGVERRLELLNMRSDEFPDDATLAIQPGMQSNLRWYLDIQRYLRAALERRRRQSPQAGSLGANADRFSLGSSAGLAGQDPPSSSLAPHAAQGIVLPIREAQRLVALGDAAGLLRLVTHSLTLGPSPAHREPPAQQEPVSSWVSPQSQEPRKPHSSLQDRTNAASSMGGSPPGGAGAPGVSPERELATLRQATVRLFEEWKAHRDDAYARRDRLADELRSRYFDVYPVMREAARVSSSVDLEKAVMAWIEQGFPVPEHDEFSSLPPGVSPDLLPAGAHRREQIELALTESRRLAAEMTQISLQGRERAQALERLCELVGGHQPRQDRDTLTGVARTVCVRCNTTLSARSPNQKEGFLL